MKGKQLDPIHPGEILREEFMGPLGLSAHRLALDLRVPATRVGEIVRGRRAITADTALRLARYFGTSSDLWLGLQAEYDLRWTRRTPWAEIERDVDRDGRRRSVTRAQRRELTEQTDHALSISSGLPRQ